MDTTNVRCPSGLCGKVRGLKASDFHSLLINNADEATPHQMADLADRVWLETTDPGPYASYGLEPGKDPAWRTDVLLGDRTHALLQARILTDGGKRNHRIQCEACGQWFTDVFNYGELDTRAWPDSTNEAPADGDGTPIPADDVKHKAWTARRQFSAHEPCCTTMPDGRNIYWSLLTGALLSGPIREYTVQLGDTFYAETAARIIRMDDLDLKGLNAARTRAAIFEALTDYSDPDFWYLWNDIQDHEVGPETDVPKNCPNPGCGVTFGYTVDTMGFIMPPPPKRWKRFRGGSRGQTQRT